jgi:hypothetical protein
VTGVTSEGSVLDGTPIPYCLQSRGGDLFVEGPGILNLHKLRQERHEAHERNNSGTPCSADEYVAHWALVSFF